MQLTQPWALLLLALVPLLWLARPQPPRRRVLVAAPHLWVARTTRLPTPSPWSWRPTPLGWVQAALAAALTVAAAGPRVSATSVWTSAWTTPDSIAIVLDASVSMQARAGETSRWNEAMAEVQRLVREQPRGTPVLLWVAGLLAEAARHYRGWYQGWCRGWRGVTGGRGCGAHRRAGQPGSRD
jgi:hypothetical protein